MNCSEASAMIAAYTDGEVDGLRGHTIRKHLRLCHDCATRHQALVDLRARIHAEVPRHKAPAALRERVLASIEFARPTPSATSARGDRWRWMAGGALAGCAATVVAWVLGTAVLDWRTNEDLAVEAVTTHVRATLGNHRIDVASSDQHTVKPWLSARLDYSPPVRDFASEGFALVGGRIDYLDHQPVATLVYRYRDHMIDVFVRPPTTHALPAPLRTVRGFNVVHATGSGMDWLAVSDLNAAELSTFAARLAGQK
ncbi:MAG TPA: anti-sigma factor [Casimicrobiaceae bacterium]|jgi:anti-sigma factor RsiW